jgi:hypothetical protein
MSCCGKKREQLSRIQRTSSRPEEAIVVEGRSPEDAGVRTFEYIGTDVLTLRGAVSGRLYHFTHPGEHIEVSREDSFAMMAESAVRLVAQGVRSSM